VQDSHIQGDTDYIWGSGTLYVTNTELMAMTTQSYLTQARTPQYSNGLAFVNCRIYAANSSVVNGTFGRDAGASGSTANYPYGQAAYINCVVDTNLVPAAGWTLGSGTTQGPATANLRFWEYQSVDLSGNLVPTGSRAAWTMQLDGATATNQVQNVAVWLYGWIPQLAPVLTSGPSSQSVAGGQSVTFSAIAKGIPSPSYQWMHNGTNMPGQTSATLVIASANAGDAGTYSVVAVNAAGSVSSAAATLTVGNSAPVFQPVADQTVNVGASISLANIATDPDGASQTLTYSLLSGPGSVDPASGLYTWRPAVSQAGASYPIAVVVSDNGTPSLSATNHFTITVNPLTQPSLGTTAWTAGQFGFTVNGQSGPDYIIWASTNLVDWAPIYTNAAPTMPFQWTDADAQSFPMRFYRIGVGPVLP
jgi:hypothetical protein